MLKVNTNKNICRGVSSWTKGNQTRDFITLNDMNESILSGINNNVNPDDILFCLGDWSFGGSDKIIEFREKVNCQNIHLILGNHDHHIESGYIRNKSGQGVSSKDLFSSIDHYLEIDINGVKMVLSHYPIASWNGVHKGWIHLFGHCHLLPQHKIRQGKSMDVGFDGSSDFRPYNLIEILDIMENRPSVGISIPSNIDHHQ